MAQNEKPSSNTMGDVVNNQGIVTQGQIGNNYIIQYKAPTISIIGPLPSVKNADGTYTVQLLIRLDTQATANSLLAAVRKEDTVPAGFETFLVAPHGGGASMVMAGEQQGYLWHKIQSPPRGQYVVQTRVRSPDAKPRIELQVE